MKRIALALALIGLGLASRPSFAVDPAGGPAFDEDVASDRADASVSDGTLTESADLAPDSASPQRSWLSRGSAPSIGDSERASSGQSSGLTLGAVLIVLGLGGAAIVVQRRRRKLGPIAVAESKLTVLSSSRIGPKAFAVTAHAGGRVILLGVTDHCVTHLGWLDEAGADTPAAADAELRDGPLDETREADGLPDDYPGSALRAGSPSLAPLASTKDLKRFQQVLAGAVQGRSDLPMRPSYPSNPPSAASTLAAQTSDVVGSMRPAPPRSAPAPSLRRKRQRRRESLPPEEPSAPPSKSAAPPSETPVEGQVAGLRALRSGR